MPNYQVLRCANDDCAKFQCQQQKKLNKWKCVVCGLRQSLKRVYFESLVPKECRNAVMEMNMHRGMAEAHKPFPSAMPTEPVVTTASTTSKWDQYVAKDSQETELDPECELDKHNRIVVGRVANEKKQQGSKVSTQKSKKRYSPYSKPANTTVTTKEQASPQPSKLVQALTKLSKPKPPSLPAANNFTTDVDKNSKWSKYAASDSEDSD